MLLSKPKSILLAGLLGLLIGLVSTGITAVSQPDYQREYNKLYETYRGESLGVSDREALNQAVQEYQQAIANDPDAEHRQRQVEQYRTAANFLAIVLAAAVAWWCRALSPAVFSLAITLYAVCGLLLTLLGGGGQQGFSVATQVLPVLYGGGSLFVSYALAHFVLPAERGDR